MILSIVALVDYCLVSMATVKMMSQKLQVKSIGNWTTITMRQFSSMLRILC
jgi:hypothetical protein